MTTLICVFLTGHLIADYLFQSSDLAMLKKEKTKYWIIHSLIYMSVFLVLSFLCIKPAIACCFAVVISSTHCVTDYLKIILDKMAAGKKQISFALFIADQIVHIGIIITLSFLFRLDSHTTAIYDDLSALAYFQKAVLYILLFVTLTTPTAIFIRSLFAMLFTADKTSGKEVPENKKNTEGKKEDPNIGFTIGILERVITAVLLLCGQYSSIGLVLTAKSIARFKQLEDKDFAEKYLIGTLTSLLVTLVASILVQKLIGN